MKHLRWVPPGDWPQEEDPETGDLRDVPVRGGMVRGMVLLGEHPDGGWLFDAAGDGEGLPGHRISEGPHRYRALPARAQEVAWRQVVYRGQGLRSDVASELDRSDPIRRSSVGRGQLQDVDYREPDPEELREAARAREDVTRVRVPLREVTDQDVVDGPPEPGARWAGEGS